MIDKIIGINVNPATMSLVGQYGQADVYGTMELAFHYLKPRAINSAVSNESMNPFTFTFTSGEEIHVIKFASTF